MRKLMISVLLVLSVMAAPAATAAEDPTCTLPIRPPWCAP